MNKKYFFIFYAVVMVAIITTFLVIKDLDDTIQFILGALAIILTSIFTYSNRRKRS